jgi:hypothetical protein
LLNNKDKAEPVKPRLGDLELDSAKGCVPVIDNIHLGADNTAPYSSVLALDENIKVRKIFLANVKPLFGVNEKQNTLILHFIFPSKNSLRRRVIPV